MLALGLVILEAPVDFYQGGWDPFVQLLKVVIALVRSEALLDLQASAWPGQVDTLGSLKGLRLLVPF